MDASEKIIRFKSYKDMLDEIERDMEDGDPLRCRYPVRFIMLNNFDVWHKLAQDLAVLGVQPLNLEELIEDNHERWITTDELSKTIRSCKEKTLVTPFSELVRFYKEADFRGFFNEIMISTEDIDHPQKRIYIPLIGLQNRFSNFLNGFSRIEESAPVWAFLTEEHKTKVYLTTIKSGENAFAGHEHIICLNTVYDWLRFWKTHAPQEQIICSSGPINRKEKNSDPDNIFTFVYIKNAHEYIESFLGINVNFAYDAMEEDYWSKLLSDIIKNGPASFSFQSFVSSHFGLAKISPKEIFHQWAQSETTAYERWLLKNYFLSSSAVEKYPYLKLSFEEITDYDNYSTLFGKVVELIFYFSESSTQNRYAAERDMLIRRSGNIFQEFTDSATRSYAKQCLLELDKSNTSLAITLTTGVFDFEKILLTAWYADRERTGLTLEKVSEKYPDLGMYLSDIHPAVVKNDKWYLDYLQAYRDAKLKDSITEEIQAFITERNHDGESFYNWYHSFQESHDLLLRQNTSGEYVPDKVYWVDALGAEFLPFLLSIFSDNALGFRVVYSDITRCTIPSATAQNRFEDVVKFGELDALAHDNAGYKKITTLVKELSVLSAKMYEIITSNSHGEHTIAIVSDHGLSCLSRLAESKKYDAKVEHDGRYIKVPADSKLYNDPDYVVHTNENDGERYKVALTHSSLGRKPVHEVHGGCTPEEVLVPFIIITNKKQNQIQYKYQLLTPEIEISEPMITVNVMPQPTKVYLHIDDQNYPMTRNGNKWSARVDGLDECEYKVEFSIPGGTSYKTTIKVNGTGFGGNNFLDF